MQKVHKKNHNGNNQNKMMISIILLCACITLICYITTLDFDSYTDNNDSLNNNGEIATATPQTSVTPTIEPTIGPTIDTDAWNLIIANPWNKLPDDFSVELTKLSNGHYIDERAYEDLQNMFDDARAEGLSPFICSSFRSNEKQEKLYNNLVNKYIKQGDSEEAAKTRAATLIAVPNTSEHQTGLTLDIVAKSYQQLNTEQENTDEQKWLKENSYKYGFILRYPSDKSDITGIVYEPWHYRYVGIEAAKVINDESLCLEEYLDKAN